MNRAIRRVGTAIVALVLLLVGQLTYLQIIHANSLANDPRNVRAALRDINHPRGPIVTADGVVVAKSDPVTDSKEFKFQRSYPLGPLYSQVVGYQSFVFGNTAVEQKYNNQLVGRDADLQIHNLPNVFSSQATGQVVLTLRNDLQQIARDALGTQRGSVVAIDAHTGGILAMYSNPTYDPNPLAGHDSKIVQAYHALLVANPSKPDLARAFRERYPPGSTFKVVTASVALESGAATPDTPFPQLSQLTLPQTTNTLHNFGGATCGGTLARSFQQSCNTTFGRLGLTLGDSFVPGMERFGINDTPPIDLIPGAVQSIGPPTGSFAANQPLFAFAGIGQGDVTTTPLQMALIAAGIANGGVIMKPHVMKEIDDSDGNLVRRFNDSQWRTAVSPSTAQAITALMVSVVQGGTGTAARISGVTVAGKTGTAQAPDGGVHAWFIGFAPTATTVVAVAVIVEHGGSLGSEATGGHVAAPIAAKILRAALNQ